ncbi:MAG: hypothetical protein DCC57_16295 [Chloroflexi bacterium]|nr:MAG: hypothetical protein DCC57_16295 [Chloroflexota bacterium]
METINWTPIIIVALLAVVAIVFALRYRGGGKATLRGPFGASLEAEGSNPTPQPEPPPRPGVNVADARSQGGGILAEDRTGRGANVERVEVQGDILASSEAPPDPDPKPTPPAS